MQAVERTLAILTAVAGRQEGVSLNDLAHETQMSLSTVHRYTATMVELGYLHRHKDKRYTVGGRGLALGVNVSDPEALDVQLRDILRRVRSATGETTFASQLTGRDVVCIAMERGTNTLQLSVRVGQTIPPLHAASARALLAFVDEPIAKQTFDKASNSDDQYKAFAQRLAAIRDRGYDVCDSEFDRGVWAVAAPVRLQRSGELYGALAVAGPAGTFSEQRRAETINLVCEASDDLAALA